MSNVCVEAIYFVSHIVRQLIHGAPMRGNIKKNV